MWPRPTARPAGSPPKMPLGLLLAAAAATAAAPPAGKLILFTDRNEIASLDPQLTLAMNPAVKGPRVLEPTEPWESWAVFAYNSVVHVGPGENRMYYDCIEGSGVPPGEARGEQAQFGGISHRRICLATSVDGKTWIKPNLGIFMRNNSTANNILLEDSGNGVFLDLNPKAPSDEKWKMICSNSVYSSADGLRWNKMGGNPVKAEDDTKPTGYFDPKLGKYVISVRRDVSDEFGVRKIGRCVTSDLTKWESEVPGGDGCPVVFSPDKQDPGNLDIYTNAWTPYPSVDSPAVHLFFPSYYHHFSKSAPWGFGNDGLLDIRLLVSRDGENISYTSTANARQPFVPLGVNDCGASTPSVHGGWCSPYSGVEARTSFDTSAMYLPRLSVALDMAVWVPCL